MFIEGYFTIERNILGLSLREMEVRLGFCPGRLAEGARILALDLQPRIEEFEPRGSTRFPDGNGLDKLALKSTKFLPGAWLGQRLVKVEPLVRSSPIESPSSFSAVEQWKLTRAVPGSEICTLSPMHRYWGRKTITVFR
jgi:hypothetical protein